jgi:hypothetical protein
MNLEFWRKADDGTVSTSVYADSPRVPRIGEQVWIDSVEVERMSKPRRPYRVVDVSWDFTDEEPRIEVILE